MQEVEIGKVTHYFGKASVAIIAITQGELKVGDTVRFKGHTSDFTEKIDSMQVEHQNVQKASPGESVGVRVNQHAREHDVVYKVTG